MEENNLFNYDAFEKLAQENEKLQRFLYETHLNLGEIFGVRKDFLLKNYSLNTQNSQNEQNIQNLKKYQLLNLEAMNFKFSSIRKLDEVLEVMNENMKRLKQFFLLFTENPNGNQIFNDADFELQLNKIKEVNELKNAIRTLSF